MGVLRKKNVLVFAKKSLSFNFFITSEFDIVFM